jgi:hypothetical protein
MMNKHRDPLALAALPLLLVGCLEAGERPRLAGEPAVPAAPAAAENRGWSSSLDLMSRASRPAYAEDRQPIVQQLVYNAEMEVAVDAYAAAETRVKQETEKLGGYVSETKSYTADNGRRNGSMKLRVPAKRFRAAVAAFSKLGEVRSRREWTQDVTAEYIDVQSRLKTLQLLEQRLLKLLDTQGAKLEGLVAVESKLADVRTQIEAQEGKLRYLKSQIEYSTITVSLYEPSSERAAQSSVAYPIVWAFEKVGYVFFGSLGALVLFVIGGAPWVVIVVFLLRWRRRRRRRAQQAGGTPAERPSA